jgi:NAD(P)-dependent dehydrogenase (short-subunit alcohol dehydrogenase family)
MACRTLATAQAARLDIEQSTHNKDVHVMELDLSSFSSTRAFAMAFTRRFGRLDILVHNAGSE